MHKYHGGRLGGASAVDWFKNIGEKLAKFYTWFLQNKTDIHKLLKLNSINPPNYDYPRQFERLLSSVGLGKKHGGAVCSCASKKVSGRRHGGIIQESDVPFRPVFDEPDEKLLKEVADMKSRKKIGGRRHGGSMSKVAVSVPTRQVVSQVVGGRRHGGGLEELLSEGQPGKQRVDRGEMGSIGGRRAPSARNLIVKKVMAEKGLSLPQASKYVKEHNLY
jgi:hypothetical protein